MKHQNRLKPIGKCKGCPLNIKKRCGVFLHPKEMWDRGRCKGFMNDELYADYLEKQEQFHAKTPRELRQEQSKRNKAEPHHDGLPNPGAARW
jgi:hypothetical protein